MLKTKKLILKAAAFLAVCLAFYVPVSAEEKEYRIVTTIFPEYDWIMNILGDRKEDIEVTWLMDSGVDLHSFNPGMDDIVTVSDCDLFIYVGGESDFWAEDMIARPQNPDQRAVSLMEILEDYVKEEEHVEGMQERPSDEEETEYDEHVWLSLRNAQIICRSLAEILGEMDESHKEEYLKNAEEYIEELREMDESFSPVFNDPKHDTLVFGDRFPFRYLFDDYGLKYYAAFNGCSAETEASFDTIIFLAEKLDELGLDTILKMEKDDARICETVIECTASKDQKILTLDSMQAVTAKDYKEGESYASVMKKNLEVLAEAVS